MTKRITDIFNNLITYDIPLPGFDRCFHA